MASATCYGAPAAKFARIVAERPSTGMSQIVLPETWLSNPYMAEGKSSFQAMSRAGGRTELWGIFFALAIVLLLISCLGTFLLLVLSEGTPRSRGRSRRREVEKTIQRESVMSRRRRGSLSVIEELDLLEEWMCGSIQHVSSYSCACVIRVYVYSWVWMYLFSSILVAHILVSVRLASCPLTVRYGPSRRR
jgi:hypothetical protein